MNEYAVIERNNRLASRLIPETDTEGFYTAERNLYKGLLFYAEEKGISDIVPMIEKVISEGEAVFGMTLSEIEAYNEGIAEENRKYHRRLRPRSHHAALYFDGFNVMPESARKLIAKDLLKKVKENNHG